MYQRSTTRPQHSLAKYSRMDPVHVIRPQGGSESRTLFQSGTPPIVTQHSPLLEPHVRNRAWSARSGEYLDDVSGIEASFADSDWLASDEELDKHRQVQQQRPAGFPLPSLVPGEIENINSQASSALTTPVRNRPSFTLDPNEDAESMAHSVYDNFQHAPEPKSSRGHLSVTFDDEKMASAQNLSVPEGAGAMRKSGGASMNSLAPDSLIDGKNIGRHYTSNIRRSKSPTPRSSVADGTAAGGQIDGSTSAQNSSEDAEKRESKVHGHSGPSSRRTVLMIAGLFAVGLILILSGIIVLTVEHHTAFRVAGCSFLGLGVTFHIICLILQKKNVKKLVNQLENDLYFLNVTENKIWNMIFHFDEQLRWS